MRGVESRKRDTWCHTRTEREDRGWVGCGGGMRTHANKYAHRWRYPENVANKPYWSIPPVSTCARERGIPRERGEGRGRERERERERA